MHEEKGNYIIDKERIIKLNDEYNFFRKWFDDVLAAADEIARGNRLLARSLMGHAGVVDAVEVVVLNQNIVARFPELNSVAEPNE